MTVEINDIIMIIFSLSNDLNDYIQFLSRSNSIYETGAYVAGD